MQIHFPLFSKKTSSDISSYDLSTSQGRMRYVKETTDTSFSLLTSPLRKQDSDAQEKNNSEMMSRIMSKLKSGKKLSSKELDFLRRNDPILYAHALRIQRMADALKQQLSHAKSKQEANDKLTIAISNVSDKDPDKEYLLAAYNEVAKEFHRSPAYQRLPATPKEAKKKKQTTQNASVDPSEEKEDLLLWSPLQELIDEAPTLECRG